MSRSNQQPTSKEPIRDPNWKFTFGKYKGNVLSEVIACDRQYINGLMENTDFDVYCDLLEDVEERYQEGMRQLFGKT